MNQNENTTSNYEDCQDMPELVDWDIELENSLQQHFEEVPSASVPSVATGPASAL